MENGEKQKEDENRSDFITRKKQPAVNVLVHVLRAVLSPPCIGTLPGPVPA